MDAAPIVGGPRRVVLAVDGGNPARVARVARIGRWSVRLVGVGAALAIGLSGPRPSFLAGAAMGAFVLAVVALQEPAYRSNEALAGLDPGGAITLDTEGLRIHASCLAEDGYASWRQVAAVVIDEGWARGFPFEAAGKRQYLLDARGVGLLPHHHPPLLAAAPVRPNVLFLLDPPVVLAWSHPQAAAQSFANLTARPWSAPASTPALWVRVENLGELRRYPEARGRIRSLHKTDVHRLRYELGDLPGPNPYRRDRGSD